jgi:hypothetical protein
MDLCLAGEDFPLACLGDCQCCRNALARTVLVEGTFFDITPFEVTDCLSRSATLLMLNNLVPGRRPILDDWHQNSS